MTIKLPQVLIILGCFVFILGISGCAKKTTVILLPDPDGKVGHITVENQAGIVDINRPGESTTIDGKSTAPTIPEIKSVEEIDADFSEALSILPLQPERFILYFEIDTTHMTKESISRISAIMSSIDRRTSVDVSVIGHTDTSGESDFNMTLSKRRALAVSKILMKKGVSGENIKAASYGEEAPLIKTADNVFEQRNRRVEVVIR